MQLDEIRRHRDQIEEIARRSGARNLRVFGSVVRGTATADSDVDVLVDLEAGRSLLDLARIELELEDLLGRSVDVVTEKSLRDRIREQVGRTAIPL